MYIYKLFILQLLSLMPANDCHGLTNCKNGIKSKFQNKKVEKN